MHILQCGTIIYVATAFFHSSSLTSLLLSRDYYRVCCFFTQDFSLQHLCAMMMLLLLLLLLFYCLNQFYTLIIGRIVHQWNNVDSIVYGIIEAECMECMFRVDVKDFSNTCSLHIHPVADYAINSMKNKKNSQNTKSKYLLFMRMEKTTKKKIPTTRE